MKTKKTPPAYFKTSVAIRLKKHAPLYQLQNLLLLAFSYAPAPKELLELTHLQRAILEDYAVRVHLKASDNNIRVPRRPSFLKWKVPPPTGKIGTIYDLIPETNTGPELCIHITGPRGSGKTILSHKLALLLVNEEHLVTLTDDNGTSIAGDERTADRFKHPRKITINVSEAMPQAAPKYESFKVGRVSLIRTLTTSLTDKEGICKVRIYDADGTPFVDVPEAAFVTAIRELVSRNT